MHVSDSEARDILARLLGAHSEFGWSASFAEEKHLQVLKRPIRSSGQLVFIPLYGLYRRLQTPFVQEFLLTRSTVSHRTEGGVIESFPTAASPVVSVFVEAFIVLFTGSWESFRSKFDIYLGNDIAPSQIILVPRDEVLAQTLSCLLLKVDNQQLVAISVIETSGDVTHNHFHEIQIIPPDQWPSYRATFDWAPGATE